MTDITDEQRAAWLDMRGMATPGTQLRTRLDLIGPLLPSELTNPQPVLPTEPDLYVSASYGNEYAWRFDEEGDWWLEGRWVELKVVASNAPFTRLVPERPQITREEIRATVGPLLTNVMNYPREISARMLGLDFSGIIVKTTDAIDELVNGADQ